MFVRPLANGDYAVAVLNKDSIVQTSAIDFAKLGLVGKFQIRDLWLHKNLGVGKRWHGRVDAHEAKVFRLKKG